MSRNVLLAALITGMIAGHASGHEVWIEPQAWTVTEGDTLKSSVRNGDDFSGFDLSWNANSVVRAEIWADGEMAAIDGRLGDRPALQTSIPSDGLVTLLYQSTHRNIVYETFEKFASFVTGKGYEAVIDQHTARDLPEAPIKEAYLRYAKALVASGSGDGSDAPRGLELELVALDNPYTMAPTDQMSVQLLYNKAPMAGNQVTVFRRAVDGSVDTLVMQSDDAGQVAFPITPGTTYLVDSVVVREPSRALVAASRGAVWESLWTSLTFRTPADQ